MPKYASPELTCGACKHKGTDFSAVNFVLCHSALTFDIAGKEGIKPEKAQRIFVCPKCGTVQIPELIHQ